MSKQILKILERKLDDLSAYGNLDAETRRNALKEELQFYVLNFIYHHPKHNQWIMYGGSALRVIHGLDRDHKCLRVRFVDTMIRCSAVVFQSHRDRSLPIGIRRRGNRRA